jgi:hypothetical protein
MESLMLRSGIEGRRQMTVKELIEKLQEMPEDALIAVWTNEGWDKIVKATFHQEVHEVLLEVEEF